MIETGRIVVDGIGTFFRRVPGEGPPVVLVHGVPDHSEQWVPFLERLPGPAYLPARFGRDYAAALPGAELLELPGLGHWPWVEQPDVVDRIVRFLCAEAP